MENLFPYLSGIRWQDIIDILLNSYIFFRLCILFRGTHVFRMLIGIIFLLFFQRIAVFIGLIVTSWAIQGITAVTALIVIVVFSSEIRSVFHAKNFKAIFWNIPGKVIHTPVQIISESVFEMGKRHCGALIVFPGKESLKDVVKNGIIWQGIITKEMIGAIFWHNNPVHDGAIVIQGNRVTEVSAILPLTPRTDLPSYYGTRHRAALGLTERKDAMVVVVSEERGVVTVAKGTQMNVMHKNDELEETLLEHMGSGKKQKGYYSNILKSKMFGPALTAFFSLLFITGIWFGISRGLNTMITLDVPIEYLNRDPSMEIVNTLENTVRLHLSGSDVLVKSIKPEQIRVKIDMGKAIMGPNSFPIKEENISLPPGIVLTKVNPAVINMEIDKPINKMIPVQIDWVGKLPYHLIIESAKLSSDRIRLIGVNRILNDISTIYTEKVPVDKIEKSGKITVGVIITNSVLKIAPDSNDKVTVEYIVKERL